MKNNKFILLHDCDNNEVIVVQYDNILAFHIEGNATKIYVKSNIVQAIFVNETPEKIFKLIEDSKYHTFVKVHDVIDNRIIGINSNHILLITTNNNGIVYKNVKMKQKVTCVAIENLDIQSRSNKAGDSNYSTIFCVHESTERIYGLITRN